MQYVEQKEDLQWANLMLSTLPEKVKRMKFLKDKYENDPQYKEGEYDIVSLVLIAVGSSPLNHFRKDVAFKQLKSSIAQYEDTLKRAEEIIIEEKQKLPKAM